CFQRDGASWTDGGDELLCDREYCHMAAAMAAASAAPSPSATALCLRVRSASSHLVWISPRRKSGSVRMRRKSPALVLIPVTVYSSRARRRRAIVSSRELPHAINLLSSGSYSLGTVQPS